LVFIVVEFLVFILMMGLGMWGWLAEHNVLKPRLSRPSVTGNEFKFLILLAASSIPNLFLLLLIAKDLGLTGQKIVHLILPIVGTPILLGYIWLRLQRTDQALAKVEAAD
jgi:hypothetical protein